MKLFLNNDLALTQMNRAFAHAVHNDHSSPSLSFPKNGLLFPHAFGPRALPATRSVASGGPDSAPNGKLTAAHTPYRLIGAAKAHL
jgi:hypothetical protein